MRPWIARLADPDRFRPNVLLTTAIGVTFIFFAIVASSIWHAHRQMREANRSLLALEQSVDNAIDLHARRVHTLFESVSRNDRQTEEKYRQTIAALDCVLISFRNVPQSGLIAGNLSNCLHAHARLKTIETQALGRMHAGDPDSAMTILFSLQRIQAEDDFHNGIHGADQTLTLQRDAVANRFTHRLLFMTVLTSGFILLLTGGWIIIVFLTRKFYRAHTQSLSALQESEIKYRRLIDALPHGVMIVQDMVIQFVNPALAAMIGCATPDDLVSVPLESIVAEKDRDRVRRIAEDRERDKQNVPDHYYVTGLRTNHEEFPAEVYVRPIQYSGRFAVQAVIMDITERKQAEEALRESEERFRNLADMAPVLIWMAGVKRHTYYLNRTWLAFTGHSVGQEYGQGWQQGVHPEDLPRVMQTYNSAFASRSPFTIEYRLRNADGTYHWLLDTGVPRFTFEHQFTGFIGSCVDISARLDAEQSLRGSEERFRTLYNKTPAMLHSIDKQGRIVNVSDYWLEVMGYERNEVIGHHATDFLTPESRHRAIENYIPEFIKKGTVKNLPHQFVTKSGQVIETILSAAAEYDTAGNFVRSLTVDVDITELRRAEKALIESEEQFRTLFETMEQGVVYQDRNGRIIRANPTAERILGLSLDEMSGKTSTDPEWGAIREDGTPFPGEMHPSMVSLLTGVPVRNIVMGILNRREDQVRWIEVDAVPQFRSGEAEPYQVYTVFSDFTERKQAEEALRQSEERFRSAFYTIPDAVNISRIDDGVFVDVNEGFTQITGYSREFIIGKSTIEINLWADLDDRQRLIDGLREHGVVRNLEAKFRMKDGSLRTCLMSAQVLMLNGVPHMLSIVRDIEERIQAQEDLRQSEARFRELFDNMSSGAAVYEAVDDGQGFVLKDFNRSGQRIEKIPAEDAIGRRVIDVFPGVEEFGILDVFRRVWRTGQPERFPLGFYKDERIAGWRDNYVYKLPTGEVVAIYDDVTEHKHAQEAVRASEEKFRRMFEEGPLGMTISSSDGRFVMVNAALCKILGYQESELTGLTLRDITHPDYVVQNEELVQQVFRGEIPAFRTVKRYLRKDGEIIWGEVTVTAIRDANGRFLNFLAMVQDINERKRAEEELERRATELQRSNAELERFAYVASHDLQEPLRMMASYAQLLEQRYQGKLDKDADEFIGFITDGAERMRQLIRDLLTFSRVDTRAKPFRKVDCQAIFEKVLTDLRLAIDEAQATVTSEPLPTVIADDTQLSQLLRNLIGNAIKFRTSASPEVHISATDADGHWQFSVRDNGIGIDPKYSDQVFVIFKRLHGRTEYPGTGIGLAVCKKIVERHGGRIWVESAPGRGTTFFFTIPKQRPAEGRTPKDGR